ncbi:unnamed protein product, partial [Mesorhabditis belari]|uniref:RRM domain-containing protein n=1 Tax=Mesorhabditis belari TaxID=2138241 RepID=A0AAF3F438_9BILA
MRQSSPAPRGGRQDRDRRRSRSRSPHGDGSRGGNRSKLIYITNLSYETRWVELKSILQELGGELAWVDILQDKTGRSKGSALAEFKDIESAENCFQRMSPRYDIGGRSVVCKQIREPQSFLRKIREETGIDYLARSGGDHHRGGSGAAAGNQRGTEANNGRQENHETYGLSMDFLRTHHIELPLVSRIFIANIPFNVGTGRLCDIFSMAGRIKWIDLQMDKDGRSKGSAVVEYMHPLEAVQSVSMFNQQKLLDRALLVKLDRYTKTDERKPGELPRGMLSIGMGLGADGAPLKDVTSVLASMGKVNDFGNQLMIQQSNMSTFGGVPAPLSITNPYGPVSGVMNTPQQSTMQYRSQSFGSGGGDSFGLGNPQTAYGGSQGAYGGQSIKTETGTPFGGSSYGSMGSSRTILIKNLPHDYTWQIVSDRVASFGDVEGVEMAGPGVARVRYVTTSDADRAKGALSGTVVEGRGIVVDFVHP